MARSTKPMNAHKQEWARQIDANQHEIFLFTPAEVAQIIADTHGDQKKRLSEYWSEHRNELNNVAGYGAVGVDSVALSRLFWDLGGFPKGVTAQAYEKVVNGQRYIILKGFPGLRQKLSGTRYLASNPKVVRMGLGQLGANQAIKSGGVITIVAMAAFRFVDYFLTDEQTLAHLVGNLATDVVKIGITMAASWAGATVVASLTTLAIGPLAAVVLVGALVGYLTGRLDENYGLTKVLVDVLDVQFSKIERGVKSWKQFFEDLPETAEQVVVEVIDYALDTAKQAGIRLVEQHINKLVPKFPRLM